MLRRPIASPPMSPNILAIAVLPLIAVVSGCTSGGTEAQRDINRGHLELRGYGLPAPWVPAYAQLLQDRLGVKYKSVAGCVVTLELVEQTEAYNSEMVAEIKRRFGADSLEKLRQEARSAHAVTRPLE